RRGCANRPPREQSCVSSRARSDANPITRDPPQPELSRHSARFNCNNRTSHVMPLTRRHFIGTAASAVALACKRLEAQEERALFWRIESPDGGRGIVFGYARVAAGVTPEVAKDGIRLMESAKRVVLDMNNTRFPAMKVDENLPPLWPKLDPVRAEQVR